MARHHQDCCPNCSILLDKIGTDSPRIAVIIVSKKSNVVYLISIKLNNFFRLFNNLIDIF
jgi:hypothetical protein